MKLIKKSHLVMAAMSGLVMAAGCTTSTPTADTTMGQCHGVNSCKGTADCGGATHSCAGKNSCKGEGWKKMSKADCQEKSGTFKTM
jgi:hypothetical protein